MCYYNIGEAKGSEKRADIEVISEWIIHFSGVFLILNCLEPLKDNWEMSAKFCI